MLDTLSKIPLMYDIRRTARVTGGPAIEVYRAGSEDFVIVENLLEFYTYEFSESNQIDVGPDGRFGYADLTDYWNLDGLHPYLMSIGSKLSGLALVQRGSVISGSDHVWDMEEFFVMRKYRRRGYGSELTKRVWRLHPGEWEIRVLDTNRAALEFWSSAVASECGKRISPSAAVVNGKKFQVFSFNVRAGA